MAERVIRVVRGTSGAIRRRPSIRGAFGVSADDDPSNLIGEELRDFLGSKRVQEIIKAQGFTGITWHTTHGKRVQPHGGKRFHIYNYAIPENASAVKRVGHLSYISTGGAMYSPDSITFRKHHTSNLQLLSGQQSGFMVTNPGFDGATRVTDMMGQLLGISANNWLMIVFSLQRNISNQAELMDFIFTRCAEQRGWIPEVERQRSETPEIAQTINRDEIVGLFTKVFSTSQSKNVISEAAKKARADAEYDIEQAYTHYRSVVAENASRVAYIESLKTPTPESIGERADEVIKSVSQNPLIGGMRVLAGSHVRVITRPIESRFWSGLKRMLITIPVMYGTERRDRADRRILLHEINFERGVSKLPDKRGMFNSDASFCLGNIREAIRRNLTGGDWDLAVMMILRGLMGDEFFKKWMAAYAAENAPIRGEKPEVKAGASGGDSSDIES